MSLCTYNELTRLIQGGMIENLNPDHINGASVDLTLGDVLWVEDSSRHAAVELAKKDRPRMQRIDLTERGHYDLIPGEFALASTREIFNMPPGIAGHFLLKSSIARAGLNHLYAGWADPGWHGSVLTLELHNCLQHHRLRLRPGMKIGQMVFWRGEAVPETVSYATRGQYNNDTEAQPSKGAR